MTTQDNGTRITFGVALLLFIVGWLLVILAALGIGPTWFAIVGLGLIISSGVHIG